jgi:hypothetical protein
LLAGQPVGEDAAKEQEGDRGDEARGCDVADVADRTAACQHRERHRHGGHRGANHRGDITADEKPEVVLGKRPGRDGKTQP